MKIKMKIAMATPGEPFSPGDVIEKPEEIAKAWEEYGWCETLEEEEKAPDSPRRKATAAGNRRKAVDK